MDPVILNNRYELLSRMGTGGMAYVYKAKDKALNRTVAVKTLKDEYAQDKDFIKRFKDEALSVAKLSHENIVNVYDVGYDNNLNYIVMECVEGTTLSSYMESIGPLEIKETIDISLQIFAALEHAHTNGIIHRDIKPQNILISKNGKIKVTDFGIAKAINAQTLTTDNKTFGSVHYISPEQAKGGFLSSSTDLYSTGIVMYEMLTGKVPFDADTPIAIVMKHLQDNPTPPIEIREDIPEELNRIILKSIQKKPSDRYETAADAMIDLKNLENIGNGRTDLTLDFIDGEVVNQEDTMAIPSVTEDDLFLDEEQGIVKSNTGWVKRNTGNIKGQKQINFDLEYNVPLVYARGRKKKEKKYFLTTLVAILMVLSLATVFVVYAIDELAKVVVPEIKEYEVLNYVTYEYDEIKKKLEEDFGIIVLMKEAYSDETPAGIIMDQDVEQGRIFKEGATNTITFTVSIGSNYVSVPECEGKDYRVVEKEIINIGLVPEKVEQYSTDIDAGIVISVSPLENTQVKYGETIRIYVSIGSQYEKTTVPDLMGLTKEQAAARLSQFNLVMNIMSEEEIPGKIPIITYQYPEAGSGIYEHSTIDVKLAVDTEGVIYEDIYAKYVFDPTIAEISNMQFPLTLRFKLEHSDQSGSSQTSVNVADLSKLPYERDIRIPAKGETKLTVFIGSVPYKDPIVYKYFDYYVPTPSPSDQPGDTPEGEPGLPDAPVEP
ncbi:MAG TPA: Stk1 family PASTA domain-containing Ser/Thr kinase [Clostridia bacterium]|nr:Stk1 family PASTA domain-containing Ser/Thr kinase [Clostridia bacterium]HXK71631.1 Stk1 family PASTA domain-containing Ser/Thr kinase [Clostridia bacterium]